MEVREGVLQFLEQMQTSEKLAGFLFQMRNYEARMMERQHDNSRSRQAQPSDSI